MHDTPPKSGNAQEICTKKPGLVRTALMAIVRQDAAVRDGDRHLDLASSASERLDRLDDAIALDHLAKHAMVAVEVRGGLRADEKLRTVGVLAGIGLMPQFGHSKAKRTPISTEASSSGMWTTRRSTVTAQSQHSHSIVRSLSLSQHCHSTRHRAA